MGYKDDTAQLTTSNVIAQWVDNTRKRSLENTLKEIDSIKIRIHSLTTTLNQAYAEADIFNSKLLSITNTSLNTENTKELEEYILSNKSIIKIAPAPQKDCLVLITRSDLEYVDIDQLNHSYIRKGTQARRFLPKCNTFVRLSI